MEDKSNLESLVDHVKDYVHTSFDIVKLKLIEKSTAVVATVVSGILLLVMFIFALILASVGLAIWISQTMHSPYAGFLIVAGLYLLLGLILVKGKETLIQTPISNILLRQIFKEEHHHE